MVEKVLVVEREKLFERGEFQGVEQIQDSKISLKSIYSNKIYLDRNIVEEDKRLKQIIPYTLLLNQYNEIYTFQRIPRENWKENRYANQYSCGIGGHINPKDNRRSIDDLLQAAINRELKEELEMKNYPIPKIVGFLNDDSNSIGKVHFGIIAIAKTNQVVEVKEKDTIKGLGFISIDETKIYRGKFESWTELSLDFLRERLNETIS